jgi:hypothetical protein
MRSAVLSADRSSATVESRVTGRSTDGSRSARRVFLACLALALLPIVVATARVVIDGWVPVGDLAILDIRSHDVLTEHHPLLGTWTSASLSLGIDVNNPGPLLFDALALPTRVFGEAGQAVGVALLNSLSIVGIAVVAHRRGGPLLGTAALAVTTALCWSMGSQLLFEAWQPYSLLLPFLCYLMLVWSVSAGDLAALPWMAGVGSFVLQTHLSYGFLVPALGAWAIIGLVLGLRRRCRDAAASGDHLRLTAARTMGVTGLVLLLCWAQPVVEQFNGDGPGNLGNLMRSLGDPPETIGYGDAVKLLATVTSVPPWWVRPSFGQAWFAFPGREGEPPSGVDLPSAAVAVACLVASAAVLCWCAWSAHRRRDRVSASAIATAAIGLLFGLVTAARVPVSDFGLAPHQFRWLWPIAAFTTFAALATLLRRLADSSVRSIAPIGVVGVLTAVLACLTLPTSDQGTSAPPAAIRPVQGLRPQMDALEGQGPLLIDDLFRTFADPYGAAVLAELQRRDIPFVADNPTLVRQFGSSRRFTGDNARATLLMRVGEGARNTPPGARRAALYEALRGDQQRELAMLEEELADHIAEPGALRLNEDGEEALADGVLPALRHQRLRGRLDPHELVSSRELARMFLRGFLVLDDRWQPTFERYVELQGREDHETVGLFLAPPPTPLRQGED